MLHPAQIIIVNRMSNDRKWKVIDWPDRPTTASAICPVCPECGWDGELEVGATPGALVIATVGLGIVFEPSDYKPPSNFLPRAIQCRGCRRIWSSETEDA